MSRINVKKCPCKSDRKPIETVMHNGKCFNYCKGFNDVVSGKTIDCCINCSEWIYGDQFEIDKMISDL